MHPMDENPYAPHFVPCGRHKLESVQFVRLQAAMSKCKPQPLQAADAEGIAKKIHWAVTRLNSRTQLESVERAKDEVRRAREIKSHATKLARLLSKQDGSLTAWKATSIACRPNAGHQMKMMTTTTSAP